MLGLRTALSEFRENTIYPLTLLHPAVVEQQEMDFKYIHLEVVLCPAGLNTVRYENHRDVESDVWRQEAILK